MANNIIFRNRNFRFLWLAQLVSFVGEGIFQTAMIWWVIQKTGSGTMVGLITSMSFLPAVLIGPFAGTMADRVKPKILLIGADLFRACLISFFGYMALTEQLQVNQLFWLCGLLSASGIFHSPTTLTVIPKIVKEQEIEEAMALHTIVRDISKLAGPALGGMIIAKWSVGYAFYAHGLCLLFSAIAIFIMLIPKFERAETNESTFTQLKAGFSYAWNQKVLFKLLMSFGFLNLFVVPIIVLLPMSVAKVFVEHTGSATDGIVRIGSFILKGSFALGTSEGTLALGSVITGLLFVKLFSNIPTSKLMIRALFLNAIIFVFFIFNNVFIFFLLGLFLLGSCFTSVNVAVLSLFQKSIAPEMKGRFFALVEVLSFALFPISLAIFGGLTDKIGVPNCYAVCATGIACIATYLLFQKDIRRLGTKSKSN